MRGALTIPYIIAHLDAFAITWIVGFIVVVILAVLWVRLNL